MATLPIHIVQANQVASSRINPMNTSRLNRDMPHDAPPDPNQDEYKRLMDHAKKQKRRIKRLSALIKGVENEGNATLFSETRMKILKCEKLLYNTIMKIKQRQAEKDRSDLSQAKKRQNAQDVEDLKKVRLERSKLVDYVPGKIEEGEKDNDLSLSIYVEAKGSTSKNPLYRLITKEEIKKNFHEKVSKKTPQPRNSKKPTILERKRLQGERYAKNNPDGQIVRSYEEPIEIEFKKAA